MKLMLMVSASPWGQSRSMLALRLLRATVAAGHEVEAVFFREDGVYHALSGRQTDRGTVDLSRAYEELAEQGNFPLLLCSASAQRRLPAAAVPDAPWREAGLAEFFTREAQADRCVCL